MEKKGTKKAAKSPSIEDFQQAYIEYILLEGRAPSSVFAFAKSLRSNEGEFYKYFNSFRALEKTIWNNWFKHTLERIESDDAYEGYTVREKLLGFYFTWIDVMKENRSFVLLKFDHLDKRDLKPYFLTGLKDHFKQFIEDLILEGKDTSEIAERPLSNNYARIFWAHFLFICRFWSNDESPEFEKTDAAIEKSVNLAFDLIGQGAIDSLVDFGKFLFQNRPSFS